MNNNSAWTGKHLAYVPAEPARSWKGVTRRLIACGTGAMMCASLLTPSAAFAAEIVSVDGTDYAAADYADGVGDEAKTWWWDGKDDLSLNNYNGGRIAAKGDLNVNYSGTNTVTASDGLSGVMAVEGTTQSGDLTLNGDADSSLNVEAEEAIVARGSLEINGGTVNTKTTFDGVSSVGGTTVDGANVNVTVMNETSNSDVYGMSAGGGFTVKNGSNVTVDATSTTSGSVVYGIISYGDEKFGESASTILIEDSTVYVVASSVCKDSIGILASSEGEHDATVTIKNSTVKVKAPYIGIAAENWHKTGCESVGKTAINISDASIAVPEGGVIGSFSYDSYYGEYSYTAIGEKGAESSDFAPVGDVLIQADKKDDTPAEDPTGDDGESEATVTPASAKGSSAAGTRLAQTGDASAAGMFAAAAAGVTALGAGAFLSRRRG